MSTWSDRGRDSAPSPSSSIAWAYALLRSSVSFFFALFARLILFARSLFASSVDCSTQY